MAYENGYLPITKVHPSPSNPRENPTPVDVESIKSTGVVERITVRPHPTKKGEYEIVTGERRWLGAKEAGLRKVPAKIEKLTDIEVRVRQLVENLQREELNDIEQGKAFRQLNKEEPFWTQKEIADKIGCKPDLVKKHRLKRGIKVFNARKGDTINWGTVDLGKKSDQKISSELGIDRHTVERQRKKRGIPSFRSSRNSKLYDQK